ncbi:hypothetical protein [Sphingomonas japonica]|uniref:Terminase small subunit n=1 Tax=Sphingomonas japonica TaxID=511662 RepID=A0ABX0U2V8_9SPHN|nr:hypothetical protein [Sphingomonas japonica]NIJ24823.1 hypothetical protein [Sphingomonas japonica]
MGRPTDYTSELADAICDRLAADESLVSICRDDAMPSTTTVHRWRQERPEFRANYARAREEQGHTVADMLGDIRRMVLSGKIEPAVATAAASIAKWEAGRRAPRDFGDKLELAGDPDRPLVHKIERQIVRPANSDS